MIHTLSSSSSLTYYGLIFFLLHVLLLFLSNTTTSWCNNISKVHVFAFTGSTQTFNHPPTTRAYFTFTQPQQQQQQQQHRLHVDYRSSSSYISISLASSIPDDVDADADAEGEETLLNEMLSTAEFAVREAGSIILSNLGCGAFEEDTCEIKTSIKDVVTVYDKACQDRIQGIIESVYPAHAILGEEDVAPGAAASEAALEVALEKNDGYMWIIDPIDGTANFSSGLALCGVIISIVYRDTPVIGVCYDPHADEMFTAVKGKGAYVQKGKEAEKERMFVSTAVTDISDAIINAGCPADKSAFDTSMKGVILLNTKARGIRVIACTALTTAWIAAGRLTAHYGYDIASWDLAAGALLIQEAGGKITDLDGSPYTLKTRNMLCSNGYVHDQVLDALREAGADSFERSK